MYAHLVVTVSLVDRETGKPLENAVVATVHTEGALDWDDFESDLRKALQAAKDRGEDLETNVVSAARTTGLPETTIRSWVHVTRFFADSELTGTAVWVPALLLVDHPEHGRTLVRIDRDKVVEQDTDPPTWRLDLGTVVIPD